MRNPRIKTNINQKQNRTQSASRRFGTRSKNILLGALLSLAVLSAPLSARAGDASPVDDVIINGYVIGFFERLAIEHIVDQDLPDGRYWFEVDTGLWGPVGRPAAGHVAISQEDREWLENRFKPQQPATGIKLSSVR